MDDKIMVENIIRSIAASFSGADSTKDWTEETIWFDASTYACVGASKAARVFDSAFGNLQSCKSAFPRMKGVIKMLISVSVILLSGFLSGWVCEKIKFPGLFGMIIAGILIGPGALSLIDPSVLNISSDLRRIA